MVHRPGTRVQAAQTSGTVYLSPPHPPDLNHSHLLIHSKNNASTTATYPRGVISIENRERFEKQQLSPSHRIYNYTYLQHRQYLEKPPPWPPPNQAPLTRPRRWNRSPSASAASGKLYPLHGTIQSANCLIALTCCTRKKTPRATD